MTDDDRTQNDIIEEKLAHLEKPLDIVAGKIEQCEKVINEIAAQVMPTLNELLKSPLLKMLGVKK